MQRYHFLNTRVYYSIIVLLLVFHRRGKKSKCLSLYKQVKGGKNMIYFTYRGELYMINVIIFK